MYIHTYLSTYPPTCHCPALASTGDVQAHLVGGADIDVAMTTPTHSPLFQTDHPYHDTHTHTPSLPGCTPHQASSTPARESTQRLVTHLRSLKYTAPAAWPEWWYFSTLFQRGRYRAEDMLP